MEKVKQQPKCVGFIMDGNRRFAIKNGKRSIEGHKEGYNKLKEILKWVKEANIAHAIVYAFSTENWNRGKEEVDTLISLLRFTLSKRIDELVNKGIKLRFVGDLSKFGKSLQRLIEKAEKQTEGNSALTLYIALSYGGRAEILNAIKQISKISKDNVEELDEESIKNYLWTKDMPDPDLVIRTGGEMRLSNFLPYQTAYSELFFTETLWPDFSRDEFDKILKEFGNRKRNHGK